MEEKVFYQDKYVVVTNARFVTGGKTYAMRNISSVQMGKISPNNTLAIIGILIGLLMIISGNTNWKVWGVVMVLLFGFTIAKSKPKYTVRINSNSGEIDGMTSKDEQYISVVIHAINEAIINH